MRKLFLFLSLFYINTAQCGYIDYYNMVNKAEWLYEQGNYKESEVVLKQAFNKVEFSKTKDIWLYVLILSKKNCWNKIYKILKNHLKKIGGTDKSIVPFLEKSGIELNNYQLRKLNNIILDTSSLSYIKFHNQLNIIDSLHNEDQRIRNQFLAGEVTLKNIGEIDSLNTLKLLDMFKNDSLTLNKKLDHKFYRILLHLELKHFELLDLYLIQMLDNGNLEPWSYARAWDRSHAINDECLNYFAYTYDSKNLNCLTYDEILKNRKKIGLSIYYSRPSYRFYVPVYKMMKIPFKEYYNDLMNNQ